MLWQRMKTGLGCLCVVMTCQGGVIGERAAASEPPATEVADEARDFDDFRYGLTVQEYQGIVERLGLDDEQLSIVDALHDELRRERFTAEEGYREARADLEAWRRSMRDGTGPEDRKERLRLYTAIVKRLNSSYRVFIDSDIERADAFLADVRLVLRLEQLEGFEAALRWRIRNRQLRWGALPYTRVDLVAITQEMAEGGELVLDRDRFGEASEEMFAAATLNYEKELDQQLRLLIAIEKDEPSGARAHGRTTRVRGFESPEEGERWRARFGEASWRLGELQKRHVGLVAYYLTEESRVRFNELVIDEAYWPPSLMSRPGGLLRHLTELEELSDVQREAVRRFREMYQKEYEEALQVWRAALDAMVAERDLRVTASFTPITVLGQLDHDVAGVNGFRDAYHAASRMNREWLNRVRVYAVEQKLIEADDRGLFPVTE